MKLTAIMLAAVTVAAFLVSSNLAFVTSPVGTSPVAFAKNALAKTAASQPTLPRSIGKRITITPSLIFMALGCLAGSSGLNFVQGKLAHDVFTAVRRPSVAVPSSSVISFLKLQPISSYPYGRSKVYPIRSIA